MDDDLYCKIYLNIGGTRPKVKSLISSILETNFNRRTIKVPPLHCDLFENKMPAEVRAKPDSEVYWPYYLEVLAADKIEREVFIKHVDLLLMQLRRSGIRSVPSGDFEDELSKP